MDRLSRLTWLLAFCAWSLLYVQSVQAAAPYDYEAGKAWYYNYPSGGPYYSAYAAAQAGADSTLPGRTSGYCSYYGTPAYVYNVQPDAMYDAFNGHYSYNWGCGTTPISDSGGNLFRATCTVGNPDCPEPPPPPFDCADLANVPMTGHADDMDDSFKPGDVQCVKNAKIDDVPTELGENGCGVYMLSEQKWHRQGPVDHRDYLVRYKFTGLECDAEPDLPEGYDVAPEEKCLGTGSDAFCVTPTSQPGCGFVNGKYMCTPMSQKCWVNSDGSRLCAENAPAPPKPTNPDKTEATPDNTFETCTGEDSCQTNQYYNTSTVNGSGTPTDGGGDPDNQGGPGEGGIGPGGSGDGDGTGDGGEGGGTASGGATCEAEPTCDGDPIQCNLLMQQWKTRCPDGITQTEAEELMGATEAEAAGDLSHGADPVNLGTLNASGILAGGACPSPISISVMGRSMSLDIWHAGCDMALLFAPFVMVMGYLSAAAIVVNGTRK